MSENKRKRYRNSHLTFRVTEEEKEFINEKMKAMNITDRNFYLRKMAIQGYCNVYKYDELFQELKAMNFYLSSVSNSINQIAKRVNSTDRFYEDDLKTLHSDVDELSRKITEMMKEYMPKKKED